MKLERLCEQSRPFLAYLTEWYNGLQPLEWDVQFKQPDKIAVISVDVINGFCYEGPLASPRIAAIVEPIARLFRKAHAKRVKHFILPQDCHPEEATEFASYPPHTICGTSEAETVAAFKELPFFDSFVIMPKQSIHSALGTDLDAWLDAHQEVDTFIAVGDCTDLCTYQLAMHLKLRANAANRSVRVIVPEDCVQTYDLPVDAAREIGAVPHDGDLLHLIFLYSMMLNGVEVVARIE